MISSSLDDTDVLFYSEVFAVFVQGYRIVSMNMVYLLKYLTTWNIDKLYGVTTESFYPSDGCI
jgi:hypothetical protein